MKILEYIDWETVAKLPQTQLQRLFHGRGFRYADYTHINIDWLSSVVLIILYKEVDRVQLDDLSEELLAKLTEIGFDVKSIQVQFRCRDFAPTEILFGEEITALVGIENKLKYHIDLGTKQNYGIYMDMKNGREWLQENSQNKRVLNLFSYTCAFSNAAIEGGASQVVNLDMSKAALAVGRENHRSTITI